MTMKIEQNCSRCHRKDSIEVADAATAVQVDATFAKKNAGAQKIKDLFAQLVKDGEMPDMVGAAGGEIVVHSYLCDPDEKSAKEGSEKRSCVNRMNELMGQAKELGPRKPKKKKGEAALPEAEIIETTETKPTAPPPPKK